MEIAAIQAALDSIAGDPLIYAEGQFARRAAAIESIEIHIIDRIAGAIDRIGPSQTLESLRSAADRLSDQLESIDKLLFERIRSGIRAGIYRGKALDSLIRSYASADSADESHGAMGYDRIDRLVAGLLLAEPAPAPTLALGPGMVAYQPTPARAILALAALADLTARDVFYDLGAGLGQVAILAHLLSGAATRGVEIEPAYCAYARRSAAALGLTGVSFVEADAREAGYADGTVFYLYTPLVGAPLRAVLGRLQAEAARRPIRLISYGPCSTAVAREGWLAPVGRAGGADGPRLFQSVA